MPELTLAAEPRRRALARLAASWQAAMRPSVLLEARRNRLLYTSWPIVILASLPFSAAIAYAAGYPVSQGPAAALLTWVAAGLPLTAALFGAVAGAGLRGPAAEAEAALPVSPREQAFSALGGAGAALAVTSLLVLAMTFLSGSDGRSVLAAVATLGNPHDITGRAAFAAAAVLGLFWILTVSFTAAFAASHAVLGAAAGVFGAAAALLPVAAGLLLRFNHGIPAGFIVTALLASGLGAAGAAASLAFCAPRAARGVRVRWTGWAAAALLPLCGALLSWPALFTARDRVLADSMPVSSFPDKPSGWSSPTGDLRESRGGRLTRLTDAGELTLIAGETPSLADLLWGKRLGFVGRVLRDSTQRIWAYVIPPDARPRELWQGDGKGPMKLYMMMPAGAHLELRDGKAFLNLMPYVVESTELYPLDPAKPPIIKGQSAIIP
ncbi:MAG: hypothetical protein HYZ75_16500 [Elusimicrobia bacterium]|nr:hypothetical protein [Elusimicrobiota bacterium]